MEDKQLDPTNPEDVKKFLSRKAMQFLNKGRYGSLPRATRQRMANDEARKLYKLVEEEQNASV